MAKIGIARQISQNVLPTVTYFTGLVGELVGMIFQIFVSQWPKGRCYGNQLNVGDVRKRHVGPPLLFASAFDNGLADHKSAFKRFNGNNQATSYPTLVNLRPVISEFTLLKHAIFAAMHPQFDDDLHSSPCRFYFPNGLKDRNFDFSRVIGNHFCTTCRNLVRFGSVTPEFNT